MNLITRGFRFTGSGAVVDWLKGHEGVCIVPKLDALTSDRGITGVLAADGEPEQQVRLARRYIAELDRDLRRARWIRSIPGHAAIERGAKAATAAVGLQNRVGVHKSNTGREGPAEWSVDRAWLAGFLERLEAGDPPDTAAYWREWAQQRLVQACPEASWRVIDQKKPFLVRSYHGSWQPLFEPFRLLAVHRDPADHFTEVVRNLHWDKIFRLARKQERTRDRARACRLFLETTREHLRVVHEVAEQEPERYLPVPFEGFVREHAAWRSRICAWSGFSAPETPGSAGFDPEVSGRNIGIWEQRRDARRALTPNWDLVEAIRQLRSDLDRLSLCATPDTQAS